MLIYARKAVSLDPMDADAHAALGYALTLTGDSQAGRGASRRGSAPHPQRLRHSDLPCLHGRIPTANWKGARPPIAPSPSIPTYPNWAIPCLRLGLVLVGRYEDAIRIQSRQPESDWNTDGFVVTAGSLASLGKKDEAKALAKRGVAKFPGLLSIERFALNRGWSPQPRR